MLLQMAADRFRRRLESWTGNENPAGNLKQTTAAEERLQEALSGFPREACLNRQTLYRKPARASTGYPQQKLFLGRSSSQRIEPCHGQWFAQPGERVRIEHPASANGGGRGNLAQHEAVARDQYDWGLQLHPHQPGWAGLEPGAVIE